MPSASPSLAAGGTVTWRRRECDACNRRFTTYERVEYALPTVVKKDGQRVPFDRDKILRGVRIACNGTVHVTSKCLSRRRLRPG